jgi:opacity protein-like surface antigen
MITAIAKSKLGIIFKNVSIAAILVFGLAETAKADQTNNYQDLHISCNPAIDQASKLNCSFSPQPTEINQGTDTEIAQGTRGRRRKSKVDGYYGGFTGGVGFASGTILTGEELRTQYDAAGVGDTGEYTNSFDGSLFGGIKFNKNISADLEFFLALGGLETESLENLYRDNGVDGNVEGDFSAFALYANPRFELPITGDDKLSVYISPGIGLSQTNVNLKVEGLSSINVPDEERDESQTGISFQIKGGAEYQITDTMDIFAQARYVTLPTGGDFDSIKIFGLDGGLKFNF